MKKFKIPFLVFVLTIQSAISAAQVVALYTDRPRCIFLQSDLKLRINLVYWDRGADEMNLKYIKGYSIDENLTKDGNGKKYLKLNFYNFKLQNYPIPQDSIMTINLYFDKIPDKVNYYLTVNKFKPGRNFTVTVPPNFEKKLTLDIPGKGDPVLNKNTLATWSPVTCYDITSIVFPQSEKN